MPSCPQLPLSCAPCCSPSVSDCRVFLQGGTERGNLLRQPLHHRVLQLGLMGAVETVEGIWVVHRVHLHTQTCTRLKRGFSKTDCCLPTWVDFHLPTTLFECDAHSLNIYICLLKSGTDSMMWDWFDHDNRFSVSHGECELLCKIRQLAVDNLLQKNS